MFQQYAIEYRLTGEDQTFGTTSVIDLDEAKTEGFEEMGDFRRNQIRKMIACRRFGNSARAGAVELLVCARLGGPTETP